MFTLTRKFEFAPDQFGQIVPEHAPGCTFLDKSERFEVAADEDLSSLGGRPIDIFQALAFRVTARTLDGLLYWTSRLIYDIADDGRVAVTKQVGYWAPTDDREDSWLIETAIRNLEQRHLDALSRWLVAEQQHSAYLEYGGKVLIPETSEIQGLLALA